MALEIDYKQLTLRDQKTLCEASGAPNLRDFMAKVQNMEPDAVAAICWVLKRQAEPEFTLEQAYDLTVADMEDIFGKNTEGTDESGSMSTSSDPSVPSTIARRGSSGSSRKTS